MKLWKCSQGHALGEVDWQGHGKSRLLMFRNAVEADGDDELDVAAIFDGLGSVTVNCSICGSRRTWVPGEEALRKLIEDHAKMLSV